VLIFWVPACAGTTYEDVFSVSLIVTSGGAMPVAFAVATGVGVFFGFYPDLKVAAFAAAFANTFTTRSLQTRNRHARLSTRRPYAAT
jgi:hypothetical protein